MLYGFLYNCSKIALTSLQNYDNLVTSPHDIHILTKIQPLNLSLLNFFQYRHSESFVLTFVHYLTVIVSFSTLGNKVTGNKVTKRCFWEKLM